MLEIMLLLPLGSVSYYDGQGYKTVAQGFILPNGIALSQDKK